jgi:hypothetical protein
MLRHGEPQGERTFARIAKFRRLYHDVNVQRSGRVNARTFFAVGGPLLEHDAIRRNRLIVESCSRFKMLERVLVAKAIPLLRNAL